MKKILIALDYSPTAQKVAEAGYALAKATNAYLLLVHVVAEPVFYSSGMYSPIMGFSGFSAENTMPGEAIDRVIKESGDFLNQIKIHLHDDTIQTLICEGDAAEAILEEAKHFEASCIVLGSHSQRWLEAIVMGSVAEKVLRLSQIPLYIIPTQKKD